MVKMTTRLRFDYRSTEQVYEIANEKFWNKLPKMHETYLVGSMWFFPARGNRMIIEKYLFYTSFQILPYCPIANVCKVVFWTEIQNERKRPRENIKSFEFHMHS